MATKTIELTTPQGMLPIGHRMVVSEGDAAAFVDRGVAKYVKIATPRKGAKAVAKAPRGGE